MEKTTPRSDQVAWSIRNWCKAVDVGPSTVYRLIDAGKIKTVKLGKKRLVVTAPGDFIAQRAGA